MTVGVLRLRYRLPSRTLKEKRTIVKSVVERVQARFHVSAAEVDDLDTTEFTTIGVACVGNHGAHVDRQLQTIARTVTEWRLDAELLDIETELITV